MFKGKSLIIAGALISSIFFAGCHSQQATRIEAGGARALTTVDKINIADWNEAGAMLVNNLISSGCLDTLGQKPVRMKVSRVINRTSQNIDTDMLTRKITMALNSSGYVRVISEDSYAKELGKATALKKGGSVALPGLVLSGKINEDRASVGNMREVTYTFYLALSDSNGDVIWEGEQQIAKQDYKNSFGF